MQAPSRHPSPSSLFPLHERSANVSFCFLKTEDFSEGLKHQHIRPASCKESQLGFLSLLFA